MTARRRARFSGGGVFCVPLRLPIGDSSCRDGKAPLKVASYAKTGVIIFCRGNGDSQPGILKSGGVPVTRRY